MERECLKCGNSYPLTEEYFHRNKQQAFNLHIYCKTCRNKLEKIYKINKGLQKKI